MAFTNPIVDAGQLVVPEVRSPNYVPGSAGWYLGRDGTFEAAQAVIRGTVVAAGGRVTLDNDGVLVADVDGSYVQLTTDPAFGAVVLLQPGNVTGLTYSVGLFYATTFHAQDDVPVLVLSSPLLLSPTRGYSRIYLLGEDNAGNPAKIDLRAGGGPVSVLDGADLLVDGGITAGGLPVLVGKTGTVSTGPAAVASFTQAVSFGVTFPAIPIVHVNLDSSAGATANWAGRATLVTTTGFTLFGYGPASTFTTAWQWSAVAES